MNDILQRFLAAARRLGLHRGLAALAALLFVMLITQGVLRAGAGSLGRAALESLKADTEATAAAKREGVADIKEYAVIGEHGFLGKKGQPQPPTLFGILGDKALFGTDPNGAEWMAVGATVPPGEKIVEINADNVVLEKDANRRTVRVFESPSFDAAPGASGPPRPSPGGRPGRGGPPPGMSAPMPGPDGSSAPGGPPRPAVRRVGPSESSTMVTRTTVMPDGTTVRVMRSQQSQ